MAQPQQMEQPQTRKRDGKQRIYLYVDEGPKEADEALVYLEKYPDDPDDADELTTRKTAEIRLDRLNESHVIVCVVRDINKDRMRDVQIEKERSDAPILMGRREFRGPVKECAPVEVAKFYSRAKSRHEEDSFDEDGLIRAVGSVCMPAAPRVQRRGDGKGNHTRWLTLRWG